MKKLLEIGKFFVVANVKWTGIDTETFAFLLIQGAEGKDTAVLWFGMCNIFIGFGIKKFKDGFDD